MSDDVNAAIVDSGVVGIVRAANHELALDQAKALLEAGLPVVEVSLVTLRALDVIAAARSLGLGFVGAGTVLDESSARAAVSAGAQFLVAPTLSEDVIRFAGRHGVTMLPGVATPTEALRAIELGADFAKLFPASAWGPGAVRDMLVALPQVRLVPTGGIALDKVADYIGAGATAVGLGSAVGTGSFSQMAERIADLLETIKRARSTDRFVV